MTTLNDDIRRRAESMKLFESDGLIHFGAWRRWWNQKDRTKAAEMLDEWGMAQRKSDAFIA